jgi:hypothetical protein
MFGTWFWGPPIEGLFPGFFLSKGAFTLGIRDSSVVSL